MTMTAQGPPNMTVSGTTVSTPASATTAPSAGAPSATVQHYQFGGCDMDLEVNGTVFQPTLTTRVLAQHMQIPPGADVLDIGCGVGALAVVAALKGAGHVDATDVMPQAPPLVEANARRNRVGDRVSAWSGDLFGPIGDRRYDVVISDVSGVVDEVSRLSPWYPLSIPTGGHDGADQIVRMLREAPDHLRPGGVLYFPTGTISNIPRTLEAARLAFDGRVELLGQVEVPFVQEFKDNMDVMARLRDAGLISYTTKRSRHLWTLEIYRAWM